MVPRVLIVSGSETERSLLGTALAKEEYVVSLTESATDALADMAASPPDLVLLDAMLPDMGAVRLLSLLTRDDGRGLVPVLVIVQHDDDATASAMKAGGAADVLYKPLSGDVLRTRIRHVIKGVSATGASKSMRAEADIAVQAVRKVDSESASKDERIGVGTDVTDCRWFEERSKRYGQIFDNAIDAIVILDPQGVYIEQNRAHEALFGYSDAELRGRTPGLQFGEAVFSQIVARLSKDGAFYGEVIGTKKSDIPISVEVSAFPVFSAKGEVTCYVAFERDITERKQAEQAAREQAAALEEFNRALEEANIAADAANRAKSEFLANMSHEIRTPMTAILGFAEVLLADPTREEITKAAQTIYRNGEHLLEIINGILDLSMIEAGKMNLERVAYSPKQLLSDVASLMRGRAETKGLTLELEFREGIPETIHTDPARLRQILINLVGNAIKFTDRGGIRVVTQAIPGGSRGLMLQFDVIDSGIGMEEEQVAKLFQPFTQGDASTRRKFGGSGLGLVISKRLAQMLGGTITVASTPGKGSTFSATVATGPFERAPGSETSAAAGGKRLQATPQVSETPDRLSCRVLLAEDGVDNQRLISLILQKAGAEVVIAADGKSAVEKVRTATAPFDVILMDMQMPVMDGYEATRFLREAGYTIPIVALTAHAMKGDREKCLEVGCDDYMTKPIHRKSLLSAVAAHAARRKEQAAEPVAEG